MQVALKFEHRTSKGCNYGPPYEWSVYRYACLSDYAPACCESADQCSSSQCLSKTREGCTNNLLSFASPSAAPWAAFMAFRVCTIRADKGTTMSW